MSEPVILLLACFVGLLLGAAFFGGLWWTVRKGTLSPQPALWFLGSVIVRMSVVLTVFYFIGRWHWERLLVCLLGFIVARLIVLRLTGPSITLRNARTKEARHAS